mmetsp:Transcript_74561/g.201704  ORF Transcript_74561/g.201704 Transcript_74561/m.201704 type:complete len:229 (-) Transcript_74561:566-1252(-)
MSHVPEGQGQRRGCHATVLPHDRRQYRWPRGLAREGLLQGRPPEVPRRWQDVPAFGVHADRRHNRREGPSRRVHIQGTRLFHMEGPAAPVQPHKPDRWRNWPHALLAGGAGRPAHSRRRDAAAALVRKRDSSRHPDARYVGWPREEISRPLPGLVHGGPCARGRRVGIRHRLHQRGDDQGSPLPRQRGDHHPHVRPCANGEGRVQAEPPEAWPRGILPVGVLIFPQVE